MDAIPHIHIDMQGASGAIQAKVGAPSVWHLAGHFECLQDGGVLLS